MGGGVPTLTGAAAGLLDGLLLLGAGQLLLVPQAEIQLGVPYRLLVLAGLRVHTLGIVGGGGLGRHCLTGGALRGGQRLHTGEDIVQTQLEGVVHGSLGGRLGLAGLCGGRRGLLGRGRLGHFLLGLGEIGFLGGGCGIQLLQQAVALLLGGL